MLSLSRHVVPLSPARQGAAVVWLILGLVTLCLAVTFFLAPDVPRRQLGLVSAPTERGDEPLVGREQPASVAKPSVTKPAVTKPVKPTVDSASTSGQAAPVVAIPVQAVPVDAVPVDTTAPVDAPVVTVVEAPKLAKASVDTAAADALLEEGRALCLKADKAGSGAAANALYVQALIPLRKAKAQFVTLSAAHPTDEVLKDRLSTCGELIYSAMKNTSYQQK